MRVDPGFMTLCRREFELCRLVEDETVVVLSRGDERLDYANAFVAAAEGLGASAFHVRLPAPRTTGSAGDGALAPTRGSGDPLATRPGALQALKQADLVIDLMFLLFSAEQTEILDSGTRMLLCLEPVEVLARLFPSRDLRKRTEAAQELLAGASTLRITNAHGTDVVYELGQYPALTEYGFTDEPGRWDHWPSGFLFTGGADDGVNGKVVLAPGDIIFPFKDYVRTPVELTIENGRILDIAGEFDAVLLRDYMAGFEDEKAYGIAHIGWGLLETAQWGILATDKRGIGMHGRSFYGNVLFSTGPNQELGGSNDTLCHVDIPMRNCSLYLDEQPIVVDGDVVVEEMKSRTLSKA
jgi:2,5-dihydroxypyridine 5,6-dioxygenase